MDSNFWIFLCFGQSNMAGQAPIEEQDLTVSERFLSMATTNGADRKLGTWRKAVPPLCRADASSVFCNLMDISSFMKNTKADPSIVPRSGINNPMINVVMRVLFLVIFTESLFCLLATYGDYFLRFVVVKAAVTAHLDVDKHIGLHQLGHENRVLTNHYRTDS